jgi:hypothetical protein
MQGLPDEKDVLLVKEHILLNVLAKLLPFEANQVQQHGFRTGKVYAQVLDDLHKGIIKQLSDNRSALKRAGVKIVKLEMTKGKAYAEYVCRGYTFDMELLDYYIKAEIEMVLAEKLGIDIEEE